MSKKPTNIFLFYSQKKRKLRLLQSQSPNSLTDELSFLFNIIVVSDFFSAINLFV